MRQALLTLMAEVAAKDELLARHAREATFKQALIDKLTHEVANPARIARLRRGSQPDLKVMDILKSELAQYEVAIVVPSYSKKLLEQELPRILSGGADQYTIQLFWLLSSFTPACLEVGATPLTFMRA